MFQCYAETTIADMTDEMEMMTNPSLVEKRKEMKEQKTGGPVWFTIIIVWWSLSNVVKKQKSRAPIHIHSHHHSISSRFALTIQFIFSINEKIIGKTPVNLNSCVWIHLCIKLKNIVYILMYIRRMATIRRSLKSSNFWKSRTRWLS